MSGARVTAEILGVRLRSLLRVALWAICVGVFVVATLNLFLVSPVFPAYRAPILSAFETLGYTVSASLADVLVLGVAVAVAGFSTRAKTGNAT